MAARFSASIVAATTGLCALPFLNGGEDLSAQEDLFFEPWRQLGEVSQVGCAVQLPFARRDTRNYASL
jgi:hypothetical protein